MLTTKQVLSSKSGAAKFAIVTTVSALMINIILQSQVIAQQTVTPDPLEDFCKNAQLTYKVTTENNAVVKTCYGSGMAPAGRSAIALSGGRWVKPCEAQSGKVGVKVEPTVPYYFINCTIKK